MGHPIRLILINLRGLSEPIQTQLIVFGRTWSDALLKYQIPNKIFK